MLLHSHWIYHLFVIPSLHISTCIRDYGSPLSHALCTYIYWGCEIVLLSPYYLSDSPLPAPPSVIDHSREKPNQEKVWALQLPSQQRHWHREHPGGPREEVRGESGAAQQGVGCVERIVLQQMEAGTLKWEYLPGEDALKIQALVLTRFINGLLYLFSFGVLWIMILRKF